VSGQKVSETFISTNKLGVVAHICDSSYMGGINRKIKVSRWAQAKRRDPIQKIS
jgi:hypothetical protein